jgi:hypothetical protein
MSSSGTGAVNVGTGNGTGLSVLDLGSTTANYVTVKGAAAASSPVIGAGGSDTNIGLTITPKGTGNTVFSSGNVGIGTTTPSTSLHIVKSNAGGVGPELRLDNNGGAAADQAQISFWDSAQARAKLIWNIVPGGTASWNFYDTGQRLENVH